MSIQMTELAPLFPGRAVRRRQSPGQSAVARAKLAELAEFQQSVRRVIAKRKAERGMGSLRDGEFIPARGSAAAKWNLPGVPEAIAQGFKYAHPFAAESAYVKRQFDLPAPWYTGEAAQAKDWSAPNASLYPQLQAQFASPWAAAFPFQQQAYMNAPNWGLPFMPMSQDPGWSVTNPTILQNDPRTGAQYAVAGPQGYPTPGQAMEKF